jgi:nucleotide-binding universal stress UspA family protein
MDQKTWSPSTIVVGVDGSEQSKHAARVAASIARATGADIHLMTVVRPPEGWWGIVASPPTSTALGETLMNARQEILDKTIAEVDFSEIEYQVVEDIGDPARMLVDYAEKIEADLLIIGKRGAGFIERMVVGSVANRVVHDAPIPVLVVP